MKKKIALALATILALSAMPMTIFAGSDNRMSKDIQVVGKQALFYYGDGYGTTDPTIREGRTYFADPDFRKEIDKDQLHPATELVFNVKDNITTGSGFRMRLTNAQWVFNAIDTISGNENDVITGNISPTATLAGANVVPTINDSNFTLNGAQGNPLPNDMYTYVFNDDNPNVAGDVGLRPNYTFHMDPNMPEEATVIFTQGWEPSNIDEVKIPMVVYIADENVDVTVQLMNNTSAVSVGSHAIASTKGGSTTNTARTMKSGREVIDLDTLIFKENRVGSLKTNGAFEIEAPEGYEFKNDPSTWKYGFEAGLGGLGNLAYIPTYKTEKQSYALYFKGNSPSASSGNSVNLPGSITISGISIQPIDDDVIPVGSVLKMTTRTFEFDTTSAVNGGWTKVAGTDANGLKKGVSAITGAEFGASAELKKLGISAGSFDVAKAVDWKMSFKTEGTVPTLVAGRLNPYRADNAVHKSAKVVFEEEEVSAWLAGRTTTFTLPEGVKIRGINWDAKTNIKSVNGLEDKLGTEFDDLTTVTKYSNNAALTVGEGYFTLKDVATETNGGENGGKVKLSFELLLSVEPNYTGETIELTASGTGIPEKLDPIEIAKVEKPITIDTKITDVQIGFQSYKVADITIKETKPGYISKDAKTASGISRLIVSIADYYNDQDIRLAPVKDSQVTITGDLKATLEKTTDGSISFVIDRPSTKEAAEIHITGLEVKIDRTVPYGVYDLVVYGDSVFSNYAKIKGATLNRLSTIVGFDTDQDGFVFEKYINVKTEGSNSALKSNVKVQADSTTAIVEGKTIELGVAPINKNGRIMVPLKFMANVFGIEDNNINWYDGNMFNDPGNRVATITSGSTSVQFKIGETTYKQFKNGAEVTKPIDNQGTAAFIDPVSNRIFLPFAAMGEAFDIKVAWDEASKTAVYNPVQE